MAIQIAGNGGTAAEVGGTAFRAFHVHPKPLEYGALGHYRTTVALTMATAQAANSRLFEIRNTHATNLIIPTRVRVGITAAGTVTASYLAQIGLWRATGFTAVDTTNTVTPTGSVKRTSSMAAYPGGAAVRHVTVAGAAAGMTGGTLTRDGNMLAALTAWVATAAATTFTTYDELMSDANGTHPLVLALNEGFVIENITAGSATANVVNVLLDVSWAEVASF